MKGQLARWERMRGWRPEARWWHARRRVTRRPWLPYLAAVAAVALFTGIIALLRLLLPGTHLAILYLLPVLGLASVWGRGPALLAAALSFLAYDFAFVEPVFTFTIGQADEWLALLVFLFTALVGGQLAATLRLRAEEARAREVTGVLLLGQLVLAQEEAAREAGRRAELNATLYELTQALLANREMEELLALIAERVVTTFEVSSCAILLPDETGRPRVRVTYPVDATDGTPERNEAALAHWTFGEATPIQATRYGDVLFVPLVAGTRRVGLMRLARTGRSRLTGEWQRLLNTFAAGAALAIDRAALAEAALRAKVLARSDELKTQLLASVSHELRTPLAAIKGSVSSLLMEATGADVTWDAATRREFLLTIDEETDRLTRLVGDLLDMSRIEAGALAPRREPYPLDELLWGVIDRLPIPGLAARVTVEVPADLPLVPLDPVLLDRVFGNLLENATRYAPAGTPLEVRAERHGGEVRVSVRDYGPGVPPTERTRVFERFYRVGPTRTGKGTGLGLAICRGFVEAHGGRIWVEEAPGGGARFVVALPVQC